MCVYEGFVCMRMRASGGKLGLWEVLGFFEG